MRFGIRDLLLLTVLVTMYLVALAVAPPVGWSWFEVALSAAPMIVIPFIALPWWMARRRIGQTLYGTRSPGLWWVHLWFASIVLPIGLYLGWRGTAFPKPVLGQFLAMHVMFLFFTSGVRFGKRGIAMGIVCMPWSEYRFELEGDRLHWRCMGRGAPFSPSQGKVRLPASDVTAIQDLLDTQQGDGEASQGAGE